MARAKLQSWEARSTIFKSMVSSVYMYGAEIWSLRYLESLEKIQNSFYKRNFNWLPSTPDYIVRYELKLEPLASTALKRALKWYRKLFISKEESIPKICFNRLLILSRSEDKKNLKFNWVSQLRSIAKSVDGSVNLDLLHEHSVIDHILARYTEKIKAKDADCILRSSYSPLYHLILEENSERNYFKEDISFTMIRTLSQLRTSGTKWSKLTILGSTFSWDQNRICEVCNSGEKETIQHVLLNCPFYGPIRTLLQDKGFLKQSESEDLQYINLLSGLNPQKILCVYVFIKNIIKLRQFAIEE